MNLKSSRDTDKNKEKELLSAAIASTGAILRMPKYFSMNDDCTDVSFIVPFKADNRKILLLDVDETLYKSTKEFKDAKRESLVRAFNKFKKEEDEDIVTWESRKKKTGSKETICEKFNIQPIKLDEERRINYGDFVERNDELINFLSNCNCRCWCFTNAIQRKAESIINKLGIAEYVEGVICTDNYCQKPISKPFKESYEFVEKLLIIDESNRNLIYFFDDKKRNLELAQALGWNVVLVNQDDNIVDLLREKVQCVD